MKNITILGAGNILFADEGFGVRVLEELQRRYHFPENVSLIDGGVLGMNLLGTISEADFLIVLDAVRNKGAAGSLYRLTGDEIPARIRAKNSLHQVDLLEALTLCQALEKVPETVILGVEPEDIDTLCDELTETLKPKIEPMIQMVIDELDRLNVTVEERNS